MSLTLDQSKFVKSTFTKSVHPENIEFIFDSLEESKCEKSIEEINAAFSSIIESKKCSNDSTGSSKWISKPVPDCIVNESFKFISSPFTTIFVTLVL